MTNVFSVSQTTFDKILNAQNEWQEMFKYEETDRVVDMHSFRGGIDHVECHAKKIVFHDIGCNGRGNDLVIIRDKARVGPESHTIIMKMGK